MPEPMRREPSSRLDEVSARDTSPTVNEVVRFEDLPLGSHGSRRAVVRWSDGSEGEALSWYAARSSSARATMRTLGLCSLAVRWAEVLGGSTRGGDP